MEHTIHVTFFMLWPIKYNHAIYKTILTQIDISDTRPHKLWDPISENLPPPKIPLLMPLSDSCSGPLFLLTLQNPYVNTDFLIVYLGDVDGVMPPLKERGGISHPSRTQNGPFSCSYTFFMRYSKLITRECGGDRDPAIQRMDGFLWQPSYILYICIINQIDLHAHAHAQTYYCISHSY